MTGDVREPGATLLAAVRRIAGDPMGAPVEPFATRASGATPFALGWATVELDRAEQAFVETFGASVGPAVPAPNDTILGASCRILALDPPGLPFVVLIEPDTEGRLAATLARHGEGPAAVWIGPAMSGDTTPAGDPAPGTGGDGPFGPQILLPGAPVTGPHRLLVPAGPGTITP
jgi:hypothetical protein